MGTFTLFLPLLGGWNGYIYPLSLPPWEAGMGTFPTFPPSWEAGMGTFLPFLLFWEAGKRLFLHLFSSSGRLEEALSCPTVKRVVGGRRLSAQQ